MAYHPRLRGCSGGAGILADPQFKARKDFPLLSKISQFKMISEHSFRTYVCLWRKEDPHEYQKR
jgi:hypothetical protein